MRYHFNVITETSQINDPEGTELPTDEAALVEAQTVIAEIRRDFPGRFGSDATLQVVKRGRRVFDLPFLIDGKVPGYLN